jgi:hypothetical protein
MYSRATCKVDEESGVINSISRVKICTLILLTATAVVSPFVFYGYYPGDDVDFHTSLWFETARQWQEGVLYARWAGQAAFGYGNAAMVFYPPLSRILGGALVAWVPSRLVLGAFGWLGIVVGGFSFFYMAREFLNDRSSAVGAFAYMINPYNLGVLYIRCAFAEFLAAALFPMFVLAVLRLGVKGKRSVALLALWIAVFWLTNIPAAIIANYLGALMVLALALIRKSKSLLGRFIIAELLGAGLAAFYLLPAWVERPLIDVGQIFAWNPLVSFLLTGGWYKDTAWLYLMLNVGFIWEVLVGTLCLFWAKKFWSKQRDVSLALGAVLGYSTLMCVSVSKLMWKYAPFLPYVQFPWRWLFPLNFAAAFFIAAALMQIKRHSWLAVVACGCSLAIILSCFTVRKRVLNSEELMAPLHSGAPIQGPLDYVPRAAGYDGDSATPGWITGPRFAILNPVGRNQQDEAADQARAETASLPNISINSWNTQSRVFTVFSPGPAAVRVRLFYFPGWHVLVNGTEVENVERDAHDAVVVQVPSGRSRVRLEFKRTRDQSWGIIISCLVAILVVAISLPNVNRQEHLCAMD